MTESTNHIWNCNPPPPEATETRGNSADEVENAHQRGALSHGLSMHWKAIHKAWFGFYFVEH